MCPQSARTCYFCASWWVREWRGATLAPGTPFFPYACTAPVPFALLTGCTFPDRRSNQDVTGLYRAVSQYRGVPAPSVSLELTPDQAIYHVGSSDLPSEYTVSNGTVYMQAEGGRVGFRILSRDTLRQTDALGNYIDYVRAY